MRRESEKIYIIVHINKIQSFTPKVWSRHTYLVSVHSKHTYNVLLFLGGINSKPSRCVSPVKYFYDVKNDKTSISLIKISTPITLNAIIGRRKGI
jgi:hypothetical protein